MSFGEAGSGNSAAKPPLGANPQQEVAKNPVSTGIATDAPAKNPIFEKIRATLQKTEPEKWRRSGEDFNPELKNPKPIEVWETLFMLSISEGNLVLRCSIPLKPEYFGGGYTLTPVADARYTIELREKGWNPRELTDPFYTNSHKKHLKMQKLLEGKMAKALYEQVKEVVETYNTERRGLFEKSCFDLMAVLLETVPTMSYESWKKDEGDAHISRYYSTIKDLSVEVAKVHHQNRVSYHLKFGRDGMYKSMSTSLVEEIFNAIENLGRDASLTHLSKLLDSIEM